MLSFFMTCCMAPLSLSELPEGIVRTAFLPAAHLEFASLYDDWARRGLTFWGVVDIDGDDELFDFSGIPTVRPESDLHKWARLSHEMEENEKGAHLNGHDAQPLSRISKKFSKPRKTQ